MIAFGNYNNSHVQSNNKQQPLQFLPKLDLSFTKQ